MKNWSVFSKQEIERRRKASNEAMRERDRQKFDEWYQKQCDTDYWRYGQCCAGCDHWESDCGKTGRCSAAGIVSGQQVLKSMGVSFSTYIPAPGFPCTGALHHCGLFKDDFDWSTLPHDYLLSIGAIRNGKLRDKPKARIYADHL